MLVFITIVKSLDLFTQFLFRQESCSHVWSGRLASSVLNPPTLEYVDHWVLIQAGLAHRSDFGQPEGKI